MIHCPNHFAAQALTPLLILRSPWARSGPLKERWATDALLAEVRAARANLLPMLQAARR